MTTTTVMITDIKGKLIKGGKAVKMFRKNHPVNKKNKNFDYKYFIVHEKTGIVLHGSDIAHIMSGNQRLFGSELDIYAFLNNKSVNDDMNDYMRNVALKSESIKINPDIEKEFIKILKKEKTFKILNQEYKLDPVFEKNVVDVLKK